MTWKDLFTMNLLLVPSSMSENWMIVEKEARWDVGPAPSRKIVSWNIKPCWIPILHCFIPVIGESSPSPKSEDTDNPLKAP